MRVEDPALDPERDVAQLGVVDELRVDAGLGFEARLGRLDAVDRGSAEAGREDVGQQKDCPWKGG